MEPLDRKNVCSPELLQSHHSSDHLNRLFYRGAKQGPYHTCVAWYEIVASLIFSAWGACIVIVEFLKPLPIACKVIAILLERFSCLYANLNQLQGGALVKTKALSLIALWLCSMKEFLTGRMSRL
jgi:hypothetical protein